MKRPEQSAGICLGAGGQRFTFDTRDAAKAHAKTKQREWNGRGKAYRCSFGDHYHVTRSRMGRSCTKGGK